MHYPRIQQTVNFKQGEVIIILGGLFSMSDDEKLETVIVTEVEDKNDEGSDSIRMVPLDIDIESIRNRLYSRSYKFPVQLEEDDKYYLVSGCLIDKTISEAQNQIYTFPNAKFVYLHREIDYHNMSMNDAFARIKFDFYIRLDYAYKNFSEKWFYLTQPTLKANTFYKEYSDSYPVENLIIEPIGKYWIWYFIISERILGPAYENAEKGFTCLGKLADLLWKLRFNDDRYKNRPYIELGKEIYNRFWIDPERTVLNYHNYYGLVYLPIFYYKPEFNDFFVMKEFFSLGTQLYCSLNKYIFCDDKFNPIRTCDIVDEYTYSTFNFYINKL